MRFEEADKKLWSILKPSETKEKRFSAKKFGRVKILQFFFQKILKKLSVTFVRKTNVTFENHKFLIREQKDRESLEQFWGALAGMAKKCHMSAGEDEWIRDIFIANIKNSDIQRRLLTELFPPLEELNVASTDEKWITKRTTWKWQTILKPINFFQQTF